MGEAVCGGLCWVGRNRDSRANVGGVDWGGGSIMWGVVGGVRVWGTPGMESVQCKIIAAVKQGCQAKNYFLLTIFKLFTDSQTFLQWLVLNPEI